MISGFASSSALCLFLSIVSHLTSAGTDWAGSVSIGSLVVVASLTVQPTRWFLTSELSPVYHMSWSVSLAAAAYWGPGLVSVLLFPLAAQVLILLLSPPQLLSPLKYLTFIQRAQASMWALNFSKAALILRHD